MGLNERSAQHPNLSHDELQLLRARAELYCPVADGTLERNFPWNRFHLSSASSDHFLTTHCDPKEKRSIRIRSCPCRWLKVAFDCI